MQFLRTLCRCEHVRQITSINKLWNGIWMLFVRRQPTSAMTHDTYDSTTWIHPLLFLLKEEKKSLDIILLVLHLFCIHLDIFTLTRKWTEMKKKKKNAQITSNDIAVGIFSVWKIFKRILFAFAKHFDLFSPVRFFFSSSV